MPSARSSGSTSAERAATSRPARGIRPDQRPAGCRVEVSQAPVRGATAGPALGAQGARAASTGTRAESAADTDPVRHGVVRGPSPLDVLRVIRRNMATRVRRRPTDGQGPKQGQNGQNQGQRKATQRKDDPAPLIPVLARRVREVESRVSSKGKASPTNRTKFLVVATLMRSERARVREDVSIPSATRADLAEEDLVIQAPEPPRPVVPPQIAARQVMPQSVPSRALANPFLTPDVGRAQSDYLPNRLAGWDLLSPLY